MTTLKERVGRRLRGHEQLTRRELVLVFLPVVLATVAAFVVAFQYVDPAPPRTVSIACGSEQGANCRFAQAYAEILAQDGVTLTLRFTAGAVENLELLQSDAVDLALVQGGLKPLVKQEDLVSLGSLFFEPLWLFRRNEVPLRSVSDLKGKRIAVGEEGSGTQMLATHLLDLNGIRGDNAELLTVGHQRAADMIAAGQLDAAIFVSSHLAPYTLGLIDSRDVTLVGLPRAEAYSFRYPYIFHLKVPEGAINLEANIPEDDLSLVAVTSQLVVRRDLHPALVSLLMQATTQVHRSGTVFEGRDEFPSPRHIDFPLSEDAARYFQSGEPFLQRYLPFWVASFVVRMKVLLLPLIVVFLPLFKIVPTLYVWLNRRRVHRWYAQLDAVDTAAQDQDVAGSLGELLAKLDDIEDKVSRLRVPTEYSQGAYALRTHIELLREKLLRRAGAREGSPDTDTDTRQPEAPANRSG